MSENWVGELRKRGLETAVKSGRASRRRGVRTALCCQPEAFPRPGVHLAEKQKSGATAGYESPVDEADTGKTSWGLTPGLGEGDSRATAQWAQAPCGGWQGPHRGPHGGGRTPWVRRAQPASLDPVSSRGVVCGAAPGLHLPVTVSPEQKSWSKKFWETSANSSADHSTPGHQQATLPGSPSQSMEVGGP